VRCHITGEVTGAHLESQLWTPGLTFADEVSLTDFARAGLSLTAFRCRLVAGEPAWPVRA
jgi:hypothetical protein